MGLFARRMRSKMQSKMRSKMRYNRKIHIFFILLIFIFIIYLITYIFSKRFMPIAISLANSRANYIATMIINETVNEKLSSGAVSYDKLYTLTKNENGQITAVQANVVQMNQLKAELTKEMQKRIETSSGGQIGIPLGSLTNNEIFSGRGPKIPIKLISVGTITMDIKNNFSSAGINQTRHTVNLEAKGVVSALLLGKGVKAEVVSTIPIAETIIVGVVPETYTHVTGTEGKPEDNVLNMLP